MTFEQALATQPQWVRIWVLWMSIVIVGALVSFIFSKATRRDAVILVLTGLATYATMLWLYSQVGFVRLLGIVHVIFWTPLAGYLYMRLKDPGIGSPFWQIMWLLLATIIVSLAFDYADVARYLLGERNPTGV